MSTALRCAFAPAPSKRTSAVIVTSPEMRFHAKYPASCVPQIFAPPPVTRYSRAAGLNSIDPGFGVTPRLPCVSKMPMPSCAAVIPFNSRTAQNAANNIRACITAIRISLAFDCAYAGADAHQQNRRDQSGDDHRPQPADERAAARAEQADEVRAHEAADIAE